MPETIPTLEERVQRIEDDAAITRLMYEYAGLCDNGYDPDAIIDLFARDTDVRWKSDVFGEFVGRDAIHEYFRQITKDFLWAAHFMINPVIDVDGDTARGSWRLFEPATLSSTTGSATPDAVVVTAEYANTFVREDGRWRFASIELTTQHITNWDQGWVRQQFR